MLLQKDTTGAALGALRRLPELAGLICLVAFYYAAYALNSAAFTEAMNIAGPISLGAILSWSCFRIVRSAPIAIWTPLFWFRLACAAYFGFGALAPHIANDETLARMLRLYNFDGALNLKVNFVCAAGILVTLVVSHAILKLGGGGNAYIAVATHTDPAGEKMKRFAFAFLGIGAILRYGIVIPHTFSITDTVLPGIVVNLSKIYYAGIYLLIRYAIQYRNSYAPIAFIIILIDITISIASFSKMELVLVLIFSFLAILQSNTRKLAILIIAGFIAISYSAFQPLVEYGRAQIFVRHGAIRGADLNERLDIVSSWMNEGPQAQNEVQQNWLSRLSYVNVNAFVIDQYDFGRPGETLRHTAAAFVPRLLWPDKPVISDLGVDLNVLVSRSTGSQLGVGHFAEAYWNFGWIGVIPFMGTLALILSIFSRVSLGIMVREDWIMMPIVFLGVNLGLRVDGHFVPDIIGPAWTAFVVGAAIYVAKYRFQRV